MEYFCSPSYSEQEKKLRHFKSYKLYEEIIQSREKLVERASPILRGVSYYLKSEIGLLLAYSKDLILDFAGCLIQLDF